MSYNLGDKTCIEADTIMLNKHTPSKLHREEMLAYSAGLVRSLQLEFLENETEEFMKKIKTIPGDIRADKLPNRKVLFPSPVSFSFLTVFLHPCRPGQLSQLIKCKSATV